MTHFRPRNAGRLFSVIVVMLASSGKLLAQDQLSIPLQPATDGVPIDVIPIDENTANEPLGIVQDAAASSRTFPPMTLEQSPQQELAPANPQIENALPPFNADEMAEEDRDDLLRGPVHEAFAEQVNSDPTPNMIVTLQPPPTVEELPPELKPNGREVEWISGYWAWDEDQDDFIWISGVWREIPQGFRWLPGYWTEVEGGFQWISGTWISTQTTEIQYLAEAPPETLELGPVGVAPASDQIWIPGTWMWNDTRYAWRPGYWSAGYESWVWVPARYQWTPRGYYHCHGYWDYPLNRRGVLFAPAYFNPRFHSNRITRFTPRVVVSTNLLTTHFWVRPQYRHYYFGNYYDVAYSNRGLTPWHQYPQQRRTFDPLYAYYSRGQRPNAYQNQLSVQFNLFVNQPNRRPAITFRDQDRSQHEGHRDIRSNELMGNRFQNLVDNSTRDRNGLQFVRLENRQREQVQQETRQRNDLGNQRRDVERSLSQLQKFHDSDDSRNARTLSGGRDSNLRHGNTRDRENSDVKERGAVADPLRLDPKVDISKGGKLRPEIENRVRDASKTRSDMSNQIEQKAETAKDQVANSTQNAGARRIQRDASQERLKLPPMSRSIDPNASTRATDLGKPSEAQNSARDRINRTDSRVRSTMEGPVNNAIRNAPAIRNSVEGRDRSRVNEPPTANPPNVRRESTPRSTPATRPAPAIRPTPAERSTTTPRSAPATRSAPARNQDGAGSTRSTPNVSPPRADTGPRTRSNPVPAAGAGGGPGRPSGGTGGGGGGGKRGKGK